MLYIVTYKGDFAFMKPFSAVRDEVTYSLQFLTPSTLMGIAHKMELPLNAIKRHRLDHKGVDIQMEQTQTKGYKMGKRKKLVFHIEEIRPRSIVRRGVLVAPTLHLAFAEYEHAAKASEQHFCLSRNEDLMLPEETDMYTEELFDTLPGGEFFETNDPNDMMVGNNRFKDDTPMYGIIHRNRSLI